MGSKYKPDSELWHSHSPDNIFAILETDERGLTHQQSLDRLDRYGPNIIHEPKRRTAIIRFVSQVNNVLLYVLIGAAALTAILEHWIDTAVILSVVIINAFIGFIQEEKAENALQSIKSMLSLKARSRRENRFLTIDADKLVPGDVVLIHSGDLIPADLRLIEVTNLQVQEAILTGESQATDKNIEIVPADAPLGDRNCMAYAGTLVTNGSAIGVVVSTGKYTEVGKISEMLSKVQSIETPLLRKVNKFNRWLTLSILAVSVGIFFTGIYITHYSTDEIFLATVGFAVAAIPEGLPPVLTITLAVGVTLLAKHNTIVRHLPSVETLGSVTVICSDKTGTLTHNELMVQKVMTAKDEIFVTGDGYDPQGDILVNDRLFKPDESHALQTAARAAVLCNDSDLTSANGRWQVHGTPMDGALLVLGLKVLIDVQHLRQSMPRTDLIPFESSHKYMATLHHDHDGNGYIYVKGAPEVILAMCDYQMHGDEKISLDKNHWLRHIEHMAEDALRVLAIAYRPANNNLQQLKYADIKGGLVLIALFGLIDPPREDAIEAVRKCHQAGVQVKMITGDHLVTAKAIARQFNFHNPCSAISGSELDKLTDEEFDKVAKNINVFARTTPEHKLRLVKSLQKSGEIVAMTGDGVNDAPALKRADIGIAMGVKGTESSKQAADVVLADDNFASISRAVEIGRKIYDNLLKTILVIVPTSSGEALVILAALLFSHILPITPLQILWVNMITAVTLGIALAFEAAEPGIMRRRPRDPRESIFSGVFVWRLIFVSLILVSGVFLLFNYEYHLTYDIASARTAAVNTIVFGEIFYLFNCRRISSSSVSLQGIFGNHVVLIAVCVVIIFQLLLTYSPLMQTLFSTSAIDVYAWIRILLFGLLLFLLVETEKYLSARFIKNIRADKITQQQ